MVKASDVPANYHKLNHTFRTTSQLQKAVNQQQFQSPKMKRMILQQKINLSNPQDDYSAYTNNLHDLQAYPNRLSIVTLVMPYSPMQHKTYHRIAFSTPTLKNLQMVLSILKRRKPSQNTAN